MILTVAGICICYLAEIRLSHPILCPAIDLGFSPIYSPNLNFPSIARRASDLQLHPQFFRYLAAKSEADHYMRELKREEEEINSVPDTEAAEIAEILSQYGIEQHEYAPVVNALRRKPQAWLDFMMKFELGLEKPDPRRALQSAFTIAIAYIIGGIVPLVPYMFIPVAQKAVIASVIATIIALLIFGYAKGYFTGNKPYKSAFQTTLIGAVASAAAFGMAKIVQR
uniref:Vacuolar iron transporter n=1 Tax=Opuntia streptacantha TaxID=393608 RepID=A0A7C9DD85_OPUST